SDEAEVNVFGTDPNNPDTDGDGFTDGEEILLYHTDPGSGSGVAPSISMQPESQTVELGSSVTFSVAANGSPPLAFQWYFNGTNLVNGATNSTLTLAGVQSSEAGSYRVTITNKAGATTSSNA